MRPHASSHFPGTRKMHSAATLPDEGIQQSRSTNPLRRVLVKGCSKVRRHGLIARLTRVNSSMCRVLKTISIVSSGAG